MRDRYDLKLDGRVIAVTGCTSGIGEATARALAEQGCRVVCLGRNMEKLEALKASLCGDGHIIRTFDSSDLATVETAIASAVNEIGKLSGLVHSAGVGMTSLLRNTDLAEVEAMFRINFLAYMAFVRACVRMGRFIANQMSVIGIASNGIFTMHPALSAYAASKSAVATASGILAKEYANRRIRFNVVAPDMVRTPMTDVTRKELGEEEYKRRFEDPLPFGAIEASDVADAILFLLSDLSSKVTGITMPITSGNAC